MPTLTHIRFTPLLKRSKEHNRVSENFHIIPPASQIPISDFQFGTPSLSAPIDNINTKFN